MLKLLTLAMLTLTCACHAMPSREDPTPGSGGAPQPDVAAKPPMAPAVGTLAFGRAEAGVTDVLGPTVATWDAQSFQWRRYTLQGVTLELGFYRDKLGKLVVQPAQPLSWAEAATWARVFLPAFDDTKLDRSKPEAWHYFEQIAVGGVPFEASLRFDRQGEQVVSIHGEMAWLD